MQQGIRHMFNRTGLDPCLTPSSNCVFVRSKGAGDLRDRRRLENACWPFHEAVISALGVRLILCLGRNALSAVCRRLGTARQIDQHVEGNLRGWTSRAFECDRGMVVVGLTHPSVSPNSSDECLRGCARDRGSCCTHATEVDSARTLPDSADR